MKFLIALALLTVVSALPPRHGFGLQQHDDHRIDGPSSHHDKHHQVNLIKLVYKQLIERLNHLPEDDNEEEESAINDIVDTINIIGEIIHDKSSDGDDNGDYNRTPILQHPEHKSQEGDVLNQPPGSDSEVPPNQQNEVEKVPSTYSKSEVISVVDNLPAAVAADDSESSESLLDVLEDDESDHDVLSLINQKDDKDDNHINIAYNSNVANEVPAL